MEVGVRSVLRIILGRLRGLVRICVHICVCGGGCGGKGRLVCRSAGIVCDVVVVLGMVGEDLRRASRFVGVGGSKICVHWGFSMSVAVRDTVSRGVSLVDIGLAGWSHSPAE